MQIHAYGSFLLPWQKQITKTLRIVKLVAIILLAGCLQLSAEGWGQSITLSEKNAMLKTVLHKIEQQSGYQFFFSDNDIKLAKSVDIEVKDGELVKVLEQCFKDQPLSFEIVDKTVVIKKREDFAARPVLIAEQPPNEISGRVTNTDGQPISNANVIIKRTGKGTITNAKGEFSLKEIRPNDVIVVSYVGFKKLSVTPGIQTNLTLVMEVATDELDKVVVQAYGTTTQRLVTGNISTVTAREIERHPVMNPLEALYGKVPGLVIKQTSGYASAPVKVEIRGRANVNGLPSDPLFIIDGVPIALNGTGTGGTTGLSIMGIDGPAQGQSPLFSINPLDIETITVLKDADATAIYGSRGANGVVIITTKRGKVGKAKLDMSIYHGISVVTQRYDMLNRQQYLNMRREGLKNDRIAPDPSIDYDLFTWDTTRYTDWQKEFWGGTGKSTDVEASYSGGDKITTFRISGDYHHQTSILNYSGADRRGSVQFNVDRRSQNQRLKTSFTSMYSYSQSNLISGPGYVTMAPDAPAVFDANGNLNFAGWAPISNAYPFANLKQPYTGKTTYLNSQFEIQYELFKGLTISNNFGYSTSHLTQSSSQPIVSQDPSSNPRGAAQFGGNDYTHLIVEPKLEYKGILSRGKISGLIGGSYQSSNFNGQKATGFGYVNDNLLYSIANAPSKNAFDGYFHYRYEAVFARLNYNWDDKYILNLSARRDGSSRFGSDRQFGNFGAVGAAWVFTEENWLKNKWSFLSFGKLRGSYGLTGSDIIDDYQYLTRWSAGTTLPYQLIPAYIPLQHANPDLHWQTNKKLEFAVNLGFLQDRLTFELVWYRNLCGDQLISYRLPNLTGFALVTTNFPATVQNTGIEATMQAKLIQKKDFEWTFNINVGANRNKLLKFPNLAESPYASSYTVGLPLSTTKMLHYTGVDPQTGQYTFQERYKDGQINDGSGPTSDLYNKDLSVRFDGGFGTDLHYKGWQLSLFFNFRRQELPSAIFNGSPGQPNVNQSTKVLDRWQKPGDIAKFARYTTLPMQSDYYYYESDAIYSDGSYVRLRNLALSYDFSGHWIEKAGLQSCRFYLREENLFVITKYNGLDPDVYVFGALPPAKVVTAGLQFNF